MLLELINYQPDCYFCLCPIWEPAKFHVKSKIKSRLLDVINYQPDCYVFGCDSLGIPLDVCPVAAGGMLTLISLLVSDNYKHRRTSGYL